MQVKHARSDGRAIIVRCRSHSLTNGRVRATKRYMAETVDWIAVYDATTACFYYVPSSAFDGHSELMLRYVRPATTSASGSVPPRIICASSGASRARTGDLVRARDALSQLSYGPAEGPSVAAGRLGLPSTAACRR